MRKLIIAGMLMALGVSLAAQEAAPIVTGESFRHGSARVTEEGFEMKLTREEPTYREILKDARGNDRFVFTVTPQIHDGDDKIVSWQAKLVDLHHATYDNVLMASPEPSSDAANTLWRLDPGKFAQVLPGAKRIIHVESFYVMLQIKAHHFTPLDSPYLDSMTVQADFRNTDPRAVPAR